MWARALALAVLATGCDGVFGLERTYAPSDAAIDAEPCPMTYSAVTGATHVYRLEMEMRLWIDAEEDCRNDSASGITHLVTFRDAAELHALQAGFGAQFPFIRVHVGYARNVGAAPLDKLSFQAVTMGPAPMDSWDSVEPNNTSAGGIQETVTSVTGNEDLADDNPNTPRPYVCSCDGISARRDFALR